MHTKWLTQWHPKVISSGVKHDLSNQSFHFAYNCILLRPPLLQLTILGPPKHLPTPSLVHQYWSIIVYLFICWFVFLPLCLTLLNEWHKYWLCSMSTPKFIIFLFPFSLFPSFWHNKELHLKGTKYILDIFAFLKKKFKIPFNDVDCWSMHSHVYIPYVHTIHHPHDSCLAITELLLESTSYDTWCYMTSYQRHSN